MTAPKKRALVEALEALTNFASRTLVAMPLRHKETKNIRDQIATARALVEAYRKEKGEG